MVDVETVFSGETINPSSESTSDSIDFTGEDTVAIQINGDSNSGSLEYQLLTTVGNLAGSFGEYTSLTPLDLANSQNQSQVKTFDVEDVSEGKLRIKNGGGSSTTIDAYSAVE